VAKAPEDIERLQWERDLYRQLLELTETVDVHAFLEEALRLVVGVTGAHRGYLELTGAGDAPPLFSAGAFRDEELPAVRASLSTGIVAKALATGETVSTASALEDPRFRDQASVQAQRIQAVLCAPLESPPPAGRHRLGVVYLQGRDSAGPFPEVDRLRLELCARHLGPLAARLLAGAGRPSGDPTQALRSRLSVDGLAGRSESLAQVFRQIAIAAPVPIAVLITGESGTGKTEIARALHRSSPRASGPFVEVNCAALPETLFESELFGAEKGAHSTATTRLDGKVAAARGGTLFLDEVGEIPLAAQGKLLSFLQSHRYFRLGGVTEVEADCRVVAATNADLPELCAQKRFREDLYYRLNVLEIHAPPLRERPEDIGEIADALVQHLVQHPGDAGSRRPLSRSARAALTNAEWPGNIRQLSNMLSRGWAVALSEGAGTIQAAHIFPDRGEGPERPTYQEAARQFQMRFLRDALEEDGWNVSRTARRLDISRSHLNDLIRAHELRRK